MGDINVPASVSEKNTIYSAGYANVRGWSRRFDLFSVRCMLVPIHYRDHWSLAIVCNPGAALPIQDKKAKDKEDEEVRILLFICD